MNIGDKVVMNENYYVTEKNKNKIFTVQSNPWNLCGTECVLLEGYGGGYAVDGLTPAEIKGSKEKTSHLNLDILEMHPYEFGKLMKEWIYKHMNDKEITSEQVERMFKIPIQIYRRNITLEEKK